MLASGDGGTLDCFQSQRAMTDQEKMRKLFDAALRAPGHLEKINPVVEDSSPVASPTLSQQAPSTAQPELGPDVPAATSLPAAPVINAGLDEATAAELGVLLDAQQRRLRQRRRRQSLVTAVVVLGLAGSGYAWFIQSPQRVQALHEAINDIRSIGDVTSLVAKYKKSLEKCQARSNQIDEATTSMGIDPTKDAGKDPYLEKEMKDMTGGNGKTVGERNRLLKERFGAMEKTGKLPGSPAPATTPPPQGQ